MLAGSLSWQCPLGKVHFSSLIEKLTTTNTKAAADLGRAGWLSSLWTPMTPSGAIYKHIMIPPQGRIGGGGRHVYPLLHTDGAPLACLAIYINARQISNLI